MWWIFNGQEWRAVFTGTIYSLNLTGWFSGGSFSSSWKSYWEHRLFCCPQGLVFPMNRLWQRHLLLARKEERDTAPLSIGASDYIVDSYSLSVVLPGMCVLLSIFFFFSFKKISVQIVLEFFDHKNTCQLSIQRYLLLIFYLLATLGLHFCVRASSNCDKWGLLSDWGGQASHFHAFSCCRAWH